MAYEDFKDLLRRINSNHGLRDKNPKYDECQMFYSFLIKSPLVLVITQGKERILKINS